MVLPSFFNFEGALKFLKSSRSKYKRKTCHVFLEYSEGKLTGNSFLGSPKIDSYFSSEEQNRRHDVRPGITGWAQVNGRNSISWDEKLNLDVEYVDNLSFILDIKILFLTVYKVFKRDGINQDGNVTIEKFTGNK